MGLDWHGRNYNTIWEEQRPDAAHDVISRYLQIQTLKHKLFVSLQQPVVITGSNLIAAASHWTLDYLEDNIGDADFSVYESGSHNFKYFDEKKSSAYANFKAPMKRLDLKFPEFVDRIENWKPGDKR